MQLSYDSRGEGRNWYMHNPHIKVYFFKKKNGEGEWTYLKRGGNEKLPERERKTLLWRREKERTWREKENAVTFRGERPIHIKFVGMW